MAQTWAEAKLSRLSWTVKCGLCLVHVAHSTQRRDIMHSEERCWRTEWQPRQLRNATVTRTWGRLISAPTFPRWTRSVACYGLVPVVEKELPVRGNGAVAALCSVPGYKAVLSGCRACWSGRTEAETKEQHSHAGYPRPQFAPRNYIIVPSIWTASNSTAKPGPGN